MFGDWITGSEVRVFAKIGSPEEFIDPENDQGQLHLVDGVLAGEAKATVFPKESIITELIILSPEDIMRQMKFQGETANLELMSAIIC